MPFNKLAVLSLVVVAVTSIQPNCEPDNQFRLYCFSIEFCNEFSCGEHHCGRFFINSKIIKIKDSKIIPKCAFSNADELKIIHGANRNIEVIASGAFVNLPQLENIILPFNFIRELHHGTFKNVTLSSLDLSWNKIVYIQEGAFDGINGLQHLNLSRNELLTIPVQRLAPSLIDLNLSHNFLKAIAVNYARFPNLTNIDFSNNELKKVALLFEKSVEQIDLNQNQLEDIDLFEVRHCEKLKIALNKFSRAPNFLKYASLKSVSLHPNPWKCSELKEVWAHLQNNFVNVDDVQTQQQGPICSESVPLNVLSKIVDLRHCEDDFECESTELCRGAKCLNPCKENVCDPSSSCIVNEHKFECLCPSNQKRDPTNIYSACLDVECFSGKECNFGQHCINNKCQSLGAPSSSYGSAYEGNFGKPGRPVLDVLEAGFDRAPGAEQGGQATSGAGYGGAPGAAQEGQAIVAGFGSYPGAAQGGQVTSGAGYGYAPGAAQGGQAYGSGSGGAPQAAQGGQAYGAGYGGATGAAQGGLPYAPSAGFGAGFGLSSGTGFESNIGSEQGGFSNLPIPEDKEPWWFYEIPRLSPSYNQTNV